MAALLMKSPAMTNDLDLHKQSQHGQSVLDSESTTGLGFQKPAVLSAYNVKGRSTGSNKARVCSQRFRVINPWKNEQHIPTMLDDYGVEMTCCVANGTESYPLPLKEVRVFASNNNGLESDKDTIELIYEAFYYGGSSCAGPNCGKQDDKGNWAFSPSTIALSLVPQSDLLDQDELDLIVANQTQTGARGLAQCEQSLFRKSVCGKKIGRCFDVARKQQRNQLDQSFKFRVANNSFAKVSASIEYRERYNRMELNRVKVSLTRAQLRKQCEAACPKMEAQYQHLLQKSKYQHQMRLQHLELTAECAVDLEHETSSEDEDNDLLVEGLTGSANLFDTQQLSDLDDDEDDDELPTVNSSTIAFDDEDEASLDLDVANLRLE